MLHHTPPGPAGELLKRLRATPELKKGRFALRWTGPSPTQLVLGIGQIHPVSRGSFDRFLARRIGKVQTWIFHACTALAGFGVQRFGQEGLPGIRDQRLQMRLSPDLLTRCKQEFDQAERDAARFFRATADDWQSALRRKDARGVDRASVALNALTLLQALHPDITVFPIEQTDVHGRIGSGIGALQEAIAELERSPALLAAKRKGGANLTREEYEAAIQYRSLVRQFNALLTHPERDRSILREVLEHAHKEPLTVFVLGEGHRRRMLSLAKEHLPPEILFAWVTPPKLIRRSLLLPLAALLALGVITAVVLGT